MSSFLFGFTDEIIKTAKEDELPTGTIAAAGAAYEGIPKALLGGLIGSIVGGKGRRLKAALGGAGIGALIGALKGSGIHGGSAAYTNKLLRESKKKKMWV